MEKQRLQGQKDLKGGYWHGYCGPKDPHTQTHTQRRRAELRHGMGLVDKADSAISSGQDDQVA